MPRLPSKWHSIRCAAVGFDADRSESASSISTGDRGCAKHWAPPQLAMYATLSFCVSVAYNRSDAVLLVCGGMG
jgi:hypothetical protein